VLFEPLRAGAAHVVQLRPIAAIEQDAHELLARVQNVHDRIPRHDTPEPFLNRTLGDLEEVVGHSCGKRRAVWETCSSYPSLAASAVRAAAPKVAQPPRAAFNCSKRLTGRCEGSPPTRADD